MANSHNFHQWEENQVTQRLFKLLKARDDTILQQLGNSLHKPEDLPKINSLIGERSLIKRLLSDNLFCYLFPEEGNNDKRERPQ